MLTEETIEVLLKWLPRDALRALDMVDRATPAIDWGRWYQTFVILEALGLIKENERTVFNSLYHDFTFTELGLKIWKYYLTRKAGKHIWNSLQSNRKFSRR